MNYISDPPELVTASINSGSLSLEYNESLDQSSVPATGDFTVKINGNTVSITNVAINNDTVTLTISPNAIFGDNITVDYTSGSNPIRDSSGSESANLSNQSVTNNTADTSPPVAPENVSALAVSGGEIQVSFDDVDKTQGSGVTSYSIKRATNSGGSYAEVGTVTDNEKPNLPLQTFYSPWTTYTMC